MADEILIFDAAGSNPDGSNPGSPLSIGPGTSYPLTEASFPAPPQNVLYASSVDTEGEIPVSRRFGNRTITIKLEMAESGASDILLDALQAKFAKLQQEGGTLKRTRKDGSTIRIYDIVAGDGWDPTLDITYYLGNLTSVTMSLPAKPVARGTSVTQADRTETTLPVLIATETGITGDTRALANSWLIDNDGTIDWWGLLWGIETDRYYTFTSSSGAGGLYYEAESRTPLSAAATAVGPSGASGGGSNVVRSAALGLTHQAVMGTQASGGGAHLSHVGLFRVFARVQTPSTNTDDTVVAFEYSQTGQFTRGPDRVLDADLRSKWLLVDLGYVNLPNPATGAVTWEGRVLARARDSDGVGNTVDVDFFFLVPCDHGSGEASAVLKVDAPTAYSARDEFNQTAGALTGKTLPVGGTWVGAGDADDFQVSGSGTITRTAVSDAASTGRYVTASTPTLTNTLVSVDATMGTGLGPASAVLARYTDANNWVMASASNASTVLTISKRVAGTITTLASGTILSRFLALVVAGTPIVLTLLVDAGGRCFAWVSERGETLGTPIVIVQDSALATGGALASGKPGIYDIQATAVANTRTYDNFTASAPPPDAAVFAGQSMQVRYDGVFREDSAGTKYQSVSSYVGDYLTVPPEGAESRDVRFIVKPIYHPQDAMDGVWIDDRIDDMSGRLTFVPRYLT